MLLSATTTALFGIWNWAASNSWNDFVVNTIRVPRYLIEVINAPPPNPGDFAGTPTAATPCEPRRPSSSR